MTEAEKQTIFLCKSSWALTEEKKTEIVVIVVHDLDIENVGWCNVYLSLSSLPSDCFSILARWTVECEELQIEESEIRSHLDARCGLSACFISRTDEFTERILTVDGHHAECGGGDDAVSGYPHCFIRCIHFQQTLNQRAQMDNAQSDLVLLHKLHNLHCFMWYQQVAVPVDQRTANGSIDTIGIYCQCP